MNDFKSVFNILLHGDVMARNFYCVVEGLKMKKGYWLTLLGYVLWASAVKANPATNSISLLNASSKFQSNWQDPSLAKFEPKRKKQHLSIARNAKLNTKLFSQTVKKQPVAITTKLQERELSATTSTIVPTDFLQVETSANYLTDKPIKAQNNAIAQNYLIPDSLGQINSVSQLKDVSPDDWAYEALRSLSERYDCISGFPDGTFRGQQSLSRYEFAAGLKTCLQQIESLIASSDQTVNSEDLQTIARLSEDFETELTAVAGRVDELESRVATLEDNQFSTTTFLNGEVIFAIADAFGGDPPGGCSIEEDLSDSPAANSADCVNTEDPGTETVFSYTARLGLQSSFTGKDRLRMFLTSGNFDDGGFTRAESLNTYMSRFGYQAGLESDVFLDILEYRFPVFNDKLVLYGAADGFALSNVLTANAPFFDIGRGAISRFGQLNPILRIGGAMDAGVGFDWSIINNIRLQAAYGTRDSGDADGGFFGADHSALGVQLLAQPTESLVTGINYVNAYSVDGVLGTYTGSINAETGGLWSEARIPAPVDAFNDTTFEACCIFFLGDQPAQINAVGGSVQWNATESLNVAAWGGYAFTDFINALPDFDTPFVVSNPNNFTSGIDNGIGDSAGEEPYAESATFSISLGLSDPFGREGDQIGFIFGMPPKLVNAGPETRGTPVPFFEQVIDNEADTVVTDNNPNLDTVGEIEAAGGDVKQLVEDDVLPKSVGEEDEATSLHFELFYRFRVNDNISLTPGLFVVTNPGHIAQNDTIYVGTIRSTFRF